MTDSILENRKLQIPNYKSQIISKLQFPKTQIISNFGDWDLLKFGICYLVFLHHYRIPLIEGWGALPWPVFFLAEVSSIITS